MSFKTLALLLLCLLPWTANAQTMYRWVDDKGVTHFSQTPPPTTVERFDTRNAGNAPRVDGECCTAVRRITTELGQLLARGVPLTDVHGLVRNEFEVELTELANFAADRRRLGFNSAQAGSQAYDVCMNGRFVACTSARTAGAASGRSGSSGSGFWVGADLLLTNAHVVANCQNIRVAGNLQARTVHSDATRDLALLRVEGGQGTPVALRSTDARLGEAVVAAGYPLAGILADDLNVTTGNVSALAGVQGERRHLQFTAPVQPGNSGGPLFDASGAVLGVVTAKLNALGVARTTGDIAQNVNFAIQIGEVRHFLSAYGLTMRDAQEGAPTRSVEDISRQARSHTAAVRCSN